MKRQTRYKTEAQIIEAIYDCRWRSVEKMNQAGELEAQAADFYKRSAVSARAREVQSQNDAWGLKLEGDRAKDKAMKFRKQATRLLDVRFKKLGKVLAAFRTEPMAAVLGNDRSVVDG